MRPSDVLSINISVHAKQGLKSSQAIGKLQSPEITGMPDFITLGKILKNGIVQVTMRIRKQAYSFHD